MQGIEPHVSYVSCIGRQILYLWAARETPGSASGKALPGQCRRRRRSRVWSLGWEDPLEKDTATHSSILAWRIPWTEEPGRPPSRGLQRVRHDWSDLAHTHACIRIPITDSLRCTAKTNPTLQGNYTRIKINGLDQIVYKFPFRHKILLLLLNWLTHHPLFLQNNMWNLIVSETVIRYQNLSSTHET